MFIEMQFQRTKLLELLRDEVQRSLPLVTDRLDNPSGGDDLLIDHLDVASVIPGAGPMKTVTIRGPYGDVAIDTRAVRVVVRVTADLTTTAKVIAAGHLGVPALAMDGFPLDIDVDLAAELGDDGDVHLVATPVAVEGLLDEPTRADLLARMPSLRRPIALPEVAGRPIVAANVGLIEAAAEATTIVALRVELADPTGLTAEPVAAWRGFFAGTLAFATSTDWALFLPGELMAGIVHEAVAEAVDGLADAGSKVRVVRAPATHWSEDGAVLSTAIIRAVDACPGVGLDIDIDLRFAVRFGLDTCGLTLTIELEWDLDDLDVFACALALVAIPGVGLATLLGIVGGPIAAGVTFILAVFGTFLSVIIVSDESHGELVAGARAVRPGDFGLEVVKSDNDHAVIRGCASLAGTLPGMEVTSVTNLALGLVVGGTLTVPEHHERELVVRSERLFDWDSHYSCSSHTYEIDQVPARLHLVDPNRQPLEAVVRVRHLPKYAYRVTHDPSVVAEPGRGFVATGVVVEARANLEPPLLVDCELLVHTTSGVRYANLGHPDERPMPPSSEELVRLRIACAASALAGPRGMKWREARWRPDPAPEKESVRVWEVVTIHAGAGLAVTVASVDESQAVKFVAGVTASPTGVASFHLVTSPSEHVAVAISEQAPQAKLVVAGSTLVPIARYAPARELIDAALLVTGAPPVDAPALGEAADQPNLKGNQAAAKPGATDLPDALGARAFGGAAEALVALAVTDAVLVFDLRGRLLHRVPITGVRAVAAVGHQLYALSPAGINLIDRVGIQGTLCRQRGASPSGRRWWSGIDSAIGLSSEGTTLALQQVDQTLLHLDRFLRLRPKPPRNALQPFLSEPWLVGPFRPGGLTLRMWRNEVVVYRCTDRRLV